MQQISRRRFASTLGAMAMAPRVEANRRREICCMPVS